MLLLNLDKTYFEENAPELLNNAGLNKAKFAEKMGGREDIWYATNIEIHDYVKAWYQLQFSADGHRVYNPTAICLYLRTWGNTYTLEPGKETLIG